MKRTNKKGGAAIVAVLIVIMLVAVGSAALVVTGRYTIQASKVADAVVKVNSKPEESSSEEVSEVDDLSSVVEEPVSNYPVKSANYQDINIIPMYWKNWQRNKRSWYIPRHLSFSVLRFITVTC